MIFGMPPFYSNKKVENMRNIVSGELTFPEHIEASERAKGLITGVFFGKKLILAFEKKAE